jgi:hypothetical protein
MKTISITITGSFDASDLAALVALVRTIDKRHPDRHFTILIDDPDSTLGEAETMLRGMMPDVPGRETRFSVHPKRNVHDREDSSA